MSRRIRKSLRGGTPDTGDSFERRVPPSRKGRSGDCDDSSFKFLNDSNPSKNGGVARRALSVGAPAHLKPVPMKSSSTSRKRGKNHALEPSPLEIASARQKSNRTVRHATASSSSSSSSSVAAATRKRPASHNRIERIGRHQKGDDVQPNQPTNEEQPDGKSAEIVNELVMSAMNGVRGTRGASRLAKMTWGSAVDTKLNYHDRTSRNKPNQMGSVFDRIPKKSRSSSPEIVNVCASSDEDTETEHDSPVQKKKKKKSNSEPHAPPRNRTREPISVDVDDKDRKADEEDTLKKKQLPLDVPSGIRKDESAVVGKLRRSRRKCLPETTKHENDDPGRSTHRQDDTKGRAPVKYSAPKPEIQVKAGTRSSVCNLSDEDDEETQRMECSDEDDKMNSDQALANDLSGLRVESNTDGSSSKKRKRNEITDSLVHDSTYDVLRKDSNVDDVDTLEKEQGEGVEQVITNITQGEVFVPEKKKQSLKLSKALGTSETQRINRDTSSRKASPLSRGIQQVLSSGQKIIEHISGKKNPNRKKRGKPVLVPGVAPYAYHKERQQQEQEAEKERERKKLVPEVAPYAYHKERQQQEQEAKKERERKEAYQRRSLPSDETRKAPGSSDEKENKTFLPEPARRRSTRLRTVPCRTYASFWTPDDSDDAYQGDDDGSFLMTMRNRKKWSGKPEVIELEDSDGEDMEAGASTSFDLSRIAIGRMVFDLNCKIGWEDRKLVLSYTRTGRSRKTAQRSFSHTIDCEKELTFVKHFVPVDENDAANDSNKTVWEDDFEQTCFVAFCVSKSEANGLASISNKYKPNAKNNDDGRKYIVAEFRSDVAWEDFFHSIPATLEPFFIDSQLCTSQTGVYTKSLTMHSKKQASSSMRSPASSGRTGSLVGMKEDEVLVVYPFGANMSEIEATAKGLHELSGGTLHANRSGSVFTDSAKNSREAANSGDDDEPVEERRARAHYLTVRVGDFDRLDAGEFLNDTLIDLFLQWMVRHDDRSSIHVFSSHFYTTLLDEGPRGVTKWTKNKKINIFSRKLVYIPINKNLHWSLCVVINPGHIIGMDDRARGCQPQPCLLFLDSLRAHQKNQVRSRVNSWLNSEWERLGRSKELKSPFQSNTMKILSPRVPYQDNAWDCGVFACRYAYAVHQLRYKVFSYDEMQVTHGEIEMITNGQGFSFGMDDIARLRLEMKTWLENLHLVYKHWKDSRDAAEAREKAVKRRMQQQHSQGLHDSSTVEVVKMALSRDNENTHRNEDQEELKTSKASADVGFWAVAAPRELRGMQTDVPEHQRNGTDSSDDEEATRRSSQESEHIPDWRQNLPSVENSEHALCTVDRRDCV